MKLLTSTGWKENLNEEVEQVKEIKRLKTRNEESEIDYEAFLEHVVMNYPELVEEFLSKQDDKSE